MSEKPTVLFGMKKQALGFIGMSKLVKPAIAALKASGGALKRVKPKNEAARLPHTEHLPIGTSNASFSAKGAPNITVGKGKPKFIPEVNASGNIVKYSPGVKGGTNPSPVASFLHEFGHVEHAKSLKSLVNSNPKALPFSPSWQTKELGIHAIPGKRIESQLLNELGANNAALQRLRQSGATPQQLGHYSALRRPSFQTYLKDLESVSEGGLSDIGRKIKERGTYGYTPDLQTMPLYNKI
jgi:hypothetical protein